MAIQVDQRRSERILLVAGCERTLVKWQSHVAEAEPTQRMCGRAADGGSGHAPEGFDSAHRACGERVMGKNH